MQAEGKPPDAVYTFKHALVQDAAHAALPKETLQDLHRRMAAILLETPAATDVGQRELIARHYDQAGLFREAARCWLEAGQQALSKSAGTNP